MWKFFFYECMTSKLLILYLTSIRTISFIKSLLQWHSPVTLNLRLPSVCIFFGEKNPDSFQYTFVSYSNKLIKKNIMNKSLNIIFHNFSQSGSFQSLLHFPIVHGHNKQSPLLALIVRTLLKVTQLQILKTVKKKTHIITLNQCLMYL